MSEHEIRKLWHYSKQNEKQVQILAQLTLKTPQEIRAMVGEGKVKPIKQRNRCADVAAVRADIVKGWKTSVIAGAHGISPQLVCHHRTALRRQGVI